uniref:Tnp_DDE_dom domain-containing protein n=1 Tax=Haemonchus contortus TaxID=6289 RepID=A0A7I5E7T5_HAECO
MWLPPCLLTGLFSFRLLGVLMQVKFPRMSDLLRALQGTVTTARGTLLNVERRRMDPRPLRRRDRLRRRRVEKEMARFKELLSRTKGFNATRTITTYWKSMARFVTEKVV